jgi:hypothetical protein
MIMQVAQKHNIETPKVEGPKIVGKINLEDLQPAKKQFFPLGNFPIKHYEAILKLAKKVNKDLHDHDAITVSKVARVKGKEDKTLCSVWYSCSKEISKQQFGKPLNIRIVELENNCRRITKQEMLDMSFGQNFFMGYMFKDGNVKTSPCVKIYTSAKDSKTGISFTRHRDHEQNANLLSFDDIKENGTFKADNAEGYLFVSNETFTNDL